MKKISSARKPTTPSSDGQATLTSFFQPLGRLEPNANQFRGKDTPSRKRDHSGVIIDIDGSSDEDDLAVLEETLPSKSRSKAKYISEQLGTSSNSVRQLRRVRASSPQSDLPNFAGTFNLNALLADRNKRNTEMETMAKLERTTKDSELMNDLEEQEKGETHKRDANVAIRNPLHLGKDSRPVFWSAIEIDSSSKTSYASRWPDLLSSLHDLPPELGLMVSLSVQHNKSDILALFVKLKGKYSLPADLGDHLVCHLLRSKDMDAVTEASRIMADHPIFDTEILRKSLTAFGIVGTTSGNGPQSLIKIDRPTEQSILELQQMRSIVVNLEASISDRGTQSQNALELDSFLSDAFRFAILLAMDSSFGNFLVVEIESLLAEILEHQSLTQSLYTSLSSSALESILLVQSVRAIPTSTERSLRFSEQLASAVFLNLPPERISQIESAEVRLRLIKEHLTSAKPFTPIDNSTDYFEISQKMAILSVAIASIPSGCSGLTLEIVERLQKLHGQIVDSKAAFLDRSEAKASIQRLADRLKYTAEAQSTKRSVFAAFR